MGLFKMRYTLLAVSMLQACGGDEEKSTSTGDEDAAEIIRGEQPASGASRDWRVNQPTDVTPPPALAMTTRSGVGLGEMELVLTYPSETGDYASVEFRRTTGTTAPADCSSGTLAVTLTDFTKTSVTDTGLYPGSEYSYTACINDAAGNTTTVVSSESGFANEDQRIFVTSEGFTGNLKATYNEQTFSNGYDGADYRCNYLADEAGLSGSWKAVIGAMPYRNITDQITFYGKVLNLESPPKVVAHSRSEFLGSTLSAAVKVDENGEEASPTLVSEFPVEMVPWSGSYYSGYSATLPDQNCKNWESGAASDSGWVGNQTAYESSAWMYYATFSCEKKNRLYCIETYEASDAELPEVSIAETSAGNIDVTVTLPSDTSNIKQVSLVRQPGATFSNHRCWAVLPFGSYITGYSGSTLIDDEAYTVSDAIGAEGWFTYLVCTRDKFGNWMKMVRSSSIKTGTNYKSIFVTAATFDGNLGGVVGANTKCSTAATNASLSGTWKAVIAGGGNAATDNFTMGGYTFDLDGNFFYSTESQLTSANAIGNGILMVDENGASVSAWDDVWTGATNTGAEGSETCSNWSTNSNGTNGGVGTTGTGLSTNWITSGNVTCDTQAHLVCIQE